MQGVCCWWKGAPPASAICLMVFFGPSDSSNGEHRYSPKQRAFRYSWKVALSRFNFCVFVLESGVWGRRSLEKLFTFLHHRSRIAAKNRFSAFRWWNVCKHVVWKPECHMCFAKGEFETCTARKISHISKRSLKSAEIREFHDLRSSHKHFITLHFGLWCLLLLLRFGFRMRSKEIRFAFIGVDAKFIFIILTFKSCVSCSCAYHMLDNTLRKKIIAELWPWMFFFLVCE